MATKELGTLNLKELFGKYSKYTIPVALAAGSLLAGRYFMGATQESTEEKLGGDHIGIVLHKPLTNKLQAIHKRISGNTKLRLKFHESLAAIDHFMMIYYGIKSNEFNLTEDWLPEANRRLKKVKAKWVAFLMLLMKKDASTFTFVRQHLYDPKIPDKFEDASAEEMNNPFIDEILRSASDPQFSKEMIHHYRQPLMQYLTEVYCEIEEMYNDSETVLKEKDE